MQDRVRSKFERGQRSLERFSSDNKYKEPNKLPRHSTLSYTAACSLHLGPAFDATLAPSCQRDLMTVQDVKYDMRACGKCVMPQYNTVQYGKKSVKYYGAKLWHILPISIKNPSHISIPPHPRFAML